MTLDRKSKNKNLLFHTAVVDALLAGYFEGNFTVAELKEHGDFGLGAFNFIDGEMVVYEGVAYHIKSDGKVYVADSEMKTPYAFVNWFKVDVSYSLTTTTTKKEFEALVEALIKSNNRICAIKFHGHFANLKVRVNPPYFQKPYPELAAIIESNQIIYNHKNSTGFLIGYRLPQFIQGVNVPGFHFHFLDEEKALGGHVFDYKILQGKIEIGFLDGYCVQLPQDEAYLKIDFSKARGAELKKVE